MSRYQKLSYSMLSLLFLLVLPVIVMAEAEQGRSDDVYTQGIKKKIVFAQFDVAKPHQIQDFTNIYDQLPELLAQRLARKGAFLTIRSPLSIPPFTAENEQSEIIKQIAASVGAQFVVLGTLKNAAIEKRAGPWVSFIGATEHRKFELDLTVYDGYLGKLLNIIPLHAEAVGEVQNKREWAIDSDSFLQTAYGQEIDIALNQLADELGRQLISEPFKARVIRMDHDEIYLDAGEETGLKVGSQLIVAVRRDKDVVSDLAGNMLGIDYKVLDSLKLHQVGAQFSLGKLTEVHATPEMLLGAYVQIDSQRLASMQAKRDEIERRHLEDEEAEKARQLAEKEALKLKWQQQAIEQEAEKRHARELAEKVAEEKRKKAEELAAKKVEQQAKKHAASTHKKPVPSTAFATYKEILEARAKANGTEAHPTAVTTPKVYSIPAKDLKDLPEQIKAAESKK